ncbi:unnamed protein product [Parnassius apollo]|uniref:(apollo) hypothetical protein n=1 Tax=Parnassius apollo TaxID=110799 RepID=A0A8S3YFU3_PARAO|nr:unnamed protein product [Parnassius apollo]
MTSNPNWPEIKKALQIHLEDKTISQQLPQDHPDIVARVAKLKFDQILEDLDKKQVFGKVSAFVYATEFQKRGLPHMHLLIIMKPGDKIHQAEELDDLMSSEIPQNDDLELRELVLKWMIHNPCERSYDLDVSRDRASQRVATENDEQRERRLKDLRQRAAQRVATENDEQRELRLQDLRQRAAQRVVTENDEKRERRLQDLRQRAAQRIATENEEQREYRLEEQRRRDRRRRRALELNIFYRHINVPLLQLCNISP